MKRAAFQLVGAFWLFCVMVLCLMGVGKIKAWIDAPPQFTVAGWDGKHFTLTRGNVAYKLTSTYSDALLTPEMVGQSLPMKKFGGVIAAELVNSGTMIDVCLIGSRATRDDCEHYLVDSAKEQ